MNKIPSKIYDFRTVERRWQNKWEEWGIYKFNRNDPSRSTYTIDTPPPYPSGEFHMGNALNWCYFDVVARFKRMQGFNVYFPQGWDCHGLPTEVRAEKELGVRKRDLSPKDFKEICVKLTDQWIKKMRETLKAVGYSIDWSLEYKTMDPDYWRKTQLSFILMFKKGYVYRDEHPVLWCPRCETAIAEAEVEYVSVRRKLYYIKFKLADEQSYIIIATTRPELLPACVAVAVHPKDKRHLKLIGKNVVVPLFNRKVKILADKEVKPDFGTGIVMICTYGDKQDVKYQRKHKLPVIKAINEQGIMTENSGKYAGLAIEDCKRKIVRDLRNKGLIDREGEVTSNVGTCWRCHTSIEILVKKQWFVRTKMIADKVLESANKIRWIPKWAKTRLVDWVKSLDWDWVISRQRIFATPIPVWYCENCSEIILAEEDWLPIDPRESQPKIPKCPKCGGTSFIGEMDVMDTWMDSSTTCAIHAGWPDDMASFTRLYPADLQPNGLDIIRTWDYYLIVKGIMLFGEAPFKTALINGMVRGADGRMMHKSYGNYVEAGEVLKKYGADALRQWALAGGTTGSDIPFRWEDVDYGWRFQLKVWNASRFIYINLRDYEGPGEKVKLSLIDKWLLSNLEKLTERVTEALENFQFNVALESIRQFFWHIFCDQYLEAVKYRLYEGGLEERRAAQYTLYEALFRLIQLLAPFTPHISEEIYQMIYAKDKKYVSIHVSPWPSVNKRRIDEESEKEGEILIKIISKARQIKSKKRIPLSVRKGVLTIYAERRPSFLEELLEDITRIVRVEKTLLVDGVSAGEAAVERPRINVKLDV